MTSSMTSSVSTLPGTSPVEQHDRAAARERTRTPGRGALAGYVRALQADGDAPTRLQHGVSLLPGLVPGCDHASITTVNAGQLQVRVASDATGRRADELQDELDDGPCLQAVRTGHSVMGHDLRTESRWLDWCSAAVVELEVTAALSVLLVSTRRPLATLNLYSHAVEGLSSVDLGLLHTLAEPLVDALLDTRRAFHRLGPAA